MTQNPSILVVSSSNTKPKSIIRLLTKSNNVVESECGIITHPWKLDTKYYTADVNIIGIPELDKATPEMKETAEALIIHMDSNKESGLQDLEVWHKLEEDCDAEVKLLLANYCTNDTKITKDCATQWCISRGFEFIELYPTITKNEDEDEDDDDEVIKEKFGVDRVVEALQIHTWSNLVLKGIEKSIKNKLNLIEENSSVNKLSIPQLNNDFLTEEGLDDFTELFSQLHMMKDSIQAMPNAQRKHCAEQMVTAFWNAIGGEEEEILDL